MYRPNDRFAALRGIAFACAIALPATTFAQADAPAPVTQLSQDDVDEIIVTGSRIARPELTAMSPFAVIGEEQIALSNTTNIENFLRTKPQFAQALGSSSNNGNEGTATVDLRNLGEERTLVLVNGKRFVPYDYQGYVDLQMIPPSLIERVEVITGGASAVYGADAVAGVVNFILKDKFEGLEIDGGYSVTEENDGEIYDFSVTAGGNFAGGRGNIVFNVGYTNQDEISQGDRPYGFEALGSDDLSPSGSQTNEGGTAFYSSFFGDPFEGGITFDPAGDPLPSGATFNFNPYNLYQVPQQKWTATALGSYEINDDTEFFVRGSFANNRTTVIIAPTGTFFFPFQINVADVADGGNPFLSDDTRALFQQIDANECDLPDTDPDTGEFLGPCLDFADTAGDGFIDVALGRRLVEFGGRTYNYENTAYQFVGGFKGTILEDQDWEVFAQYGRTNRSQYFINDINADRVQQSLLAVDDGEGGVACSDPSNGCIPGNWLGAGNLSQAAANWTKLAVSEVNKTDQFVIGGSLSGNVPFTVPTAADAVGYAVGVEYRHDQGENRPDEVYISGISPGYGSSSPVDAEIEIQEVFAELLVPLVADMAFAESINFETGIRYGKYDNKVIDVLAGTSQENTFYNTSYKFGVDWSPIDELRFNVMYQRAVRAPTLREIGLPKTPSTGDLTDDPCDNEGGVPPGLAPLCEATGVPPGLTGTFTSIVAGQINNFLGGNPNLDPEEADTWTYGLDWNPSFLEGLSISVDYYDIEIEDAIVELTEQDIVDACYFYEQNAAGTFCSLISRNPINGALIGGTETGVFRSLANVAQESATGVDFDIRYVFDLGSNGSLDIGWAATYVIDRKTQPAEFIDEYDCTGLVGNTCLRPTPEWTFVQSTTWTVGPATVQLLWRYIDSITHDTIGLGTGSPSDFAVPTIASQSYFDLTGAYDVNETWTVRAGITNLFDRDPPIVGNDYGGTTENSGNTYPATYPSVGRGFYLGANAKF